MKQFAGFFFDRLDPLLRLREVPSIEAKLIHIRSFLISSGAEARILTHIVQSKYSNQFLPRMRGLLIDSLEIEHQRHVVKKGTLLILFLDGRVNITGGLVDIGHLNDAEVRAVLYFGDLLGDPLACPVAQVDIAHVSWRKPSSDGGLAGFVGQGLPGASEGFGARFPDGLLFGLLRLVRCYLLGVFHSLELLLHIANVGVL
mmetsp:Transcript_8426/g.18604  ORF Transcript_8426/g.18604 Transcript_8426/m.18604 type:complete len:201 (+) Transcript_8426:202-804(+)